MILNMHVWIRYAIWKGNFKMHFAFSSKNYVWESAIPPTKSRTPVCGQKQNWPWCQVNNTSHSVCFRENYDLGCWFSLHSFTWFLLWILLRLCSLINYINLIPSIDIFKKKLSTTWIKSKFNTFISLDFL